MAVHTSRERRNMVLKIVDVGLSEANMLVKAIFEFVL